MPSQKSIVINEDPVRSYQSDLAPLTVEPRRNRADQFFLVALGKWMDPIRDPENGCRLVDPAERLELVQQGISVTGKSDREKDGQDRRFASCTSAKRSESATISSHIARRRTKQMVTVLKGEISWLNSACDYGGNLETGEDDSRERGVRDLKT